MSAVHYGVKGRYKFIRREAMPDGNGGFIPGEIIQETPWTDNTMTVYYFDNIAFAQDNHYANSCAVGTGSGPVAESNTGLTTFLAGTNQRLAQSEVRQYTTSPRYCRQTCTYRFNPGVAAGNITEAAICTPNSVPTAATPIISRVLVLDGVGAPTSITVLLDEYLDVIWQFTVYVPEDQTGSVNFTIDGTVISYSYTIRACNMNAASRWGGIGWSGAPVISINLAAGGYGCFASTQSTLGAYDGEPSNSGDCSSVVNQTWAAGSHSCTKRITWGLTTANVAIRSFVARATDSTAGGLGAVNILLNNPVTKVNTKTFTLDLKYTMANIP